MIRIKARNTKDKSKEVRMGSFYKKLDKSFFKGKITIPNEEINGLIDVSKWEIGHSENIKIIFEKENFNATIAYKPRDKK